MKEQEVDFWKEVEMLKRFSGTFHDHLVTLLMTWSIEDRHYFLFPWADCDLELYWENDANRLPIDPVTREMDMDAMRWLSSQVLGLTKALHLIHNPSHLGLKPEELKYGRHGDIKAQNILYYPSRKYPRGILVIADFGLGAFNSDKSRSNIPGEKIPGTPHYRPPECDLAGGTISRSFDIWTYGCLLLELVCWALGGNDKLEDFHEYRYTPYITGSESDIFFDVQQKGEGKKYVVKVKEKVSEVGIIGCILRGPDEGISADITYSISSSFMLSSHAHNISTTSWI
jgi:serine/threonine protein kinase